MRSVFLHSRNFDKFDYGQDHPFKVARARLIHESCFRYGLFDPEWVSVREVEAVDCSAALAFHEPAYLEQLALANEGQWNDSMLLAGLGTADNPVFKGVLDLALLCLGATLTGIELLQAGEVDAAFNPVGGFHHAGAEHAEGFCYLNDICVAINRLLERGYQRVLYVDIDAHHCNGVQNAYYADPRVLVFSMHQSSETLYPGTGFENEFGQGAGQGYTVNLPLPEYTDDRNFERAFFEVYPEIIEAFRPQIVIAQIGMDTLKRDPLTNLRCTNNGYRRVVRSIRQSCDKVLALGGGGYSLKDAVRGWTLAWAELNGLEPVDPYAGLVGGNLYGQPGQELLDDPYVLPDALGADVERYIDARLAYLKQYVLPLLR